MIYQKGYLVFEKPIEQMEDYQMKSFYYQKIPGIREFRVSMAKDKAFLYVPDKPEASFQEMAHTLTKNELIRFIHGIGLILERMEDYLLYEEHCLLRPEWIQCNKSDDILETEILYLPMIRVSEGGCAEVAAEVEVEELQEWTMERDKKPLLTLLAECFNRLNEMEGFYYFMQIKENLQSEDDESRSLAWSEILGDFAKSYKYKSNSCI